jgi:hypothetical protein
MNPAIPIAAGGVGVMALKKLFSQKDHDAYVKSTYKALSREAGEMTSIFVDYHHYNPKGAGNTRGLNIDTDHYPDHVVQSPPGSPNLIIEVEEEHTLDQDARSQLEDFQVQGYKRLLVVPNRATDVAEAFVDELAGKVTVTTPSEVSQYIS